MNNLFKFKKMKDPIMSINTGKISNDYNYKNNVNVISNHNLCQKPENIICSTQQIMEENDYMNVKYSVNNYQKILQDFQYLNALLNKKNIALENELELLKNKYNEAKNDIDDINKHISICKENQEKVMSDLIERNDYLENLLSKNVNENLNVNNNEDNNKNNINKNNENELSNYKKNMNLNLFIYKMKKIFKNDIEMNDKITDEEYLNQISNNIIKINDELIKCKSDIEQKDLEINNLKNENKTLKLKLQQLNYNNNNKQSINASSNKE